MRTFLTGSTLTLAVLGPVAAFAQDLPGAGCFGRTYDKAHLEMHPNQNVREIRASMSQSDEYNQSFLSILVLFRDDPREFSADTYCPEDANGDCLIECDGGNISPSLTANGDMRLETFGLRAETEEVLPGEEPAGCGMAVTRSIADDAPVEAEQPTVFILHPRDSRECAWAD